MASVRLPAVGRTGRLMLGASALTTLGAIPPFLLGAQAVLMMRDLGFGPAGLGIAVSTFFAVAALCTILGSGLLERWDPRTGRVVAGSLVAAGALGTCLLVHDWPSLVVAMAVLGAGNAACQGTSNRVVSSLLPAHRRGLGFGIKQSAVPAAIMLGGLAVPTTTAFFGWRSTYLISGVVGLLVLGFALLRRGETVPSRAAGGSTSAAAGSRTSGSAGSALETAPWGPLLLCGAAITFASTAANFLGAYLASWAHEVGLTIEQAGLLMAAGSGSSVLMRVWTGFRADQRYGANLPRVAAMIVAGAVALVGIGAVAEPWAVVTFGLLAFALGWSWPGLMLYAVARLGRNAPTQASSVVQAGAFVGGALGPALMGWIVLVLGFREAWWCAAAAFAVAAVLTVLAREGFRRDLLRRPPAEPFGFGGGRDEPRWVAGPGSEADSRPGPDPR